MNSFLTHCTLCTALMYDFSSSGHPLSPASFLVCQHRGLLPNLAQWLRPSSRHFQGLPGAGSGRRTQVKLYCAWVHFHPKRYSSCSIFSDSSQPTFKGRLNPINPFPPPSRWVLAPVCKKGNSYTPRAAGSQLLWSTLRLWERMRGNSWTCSAQLHHVVGL